MENFQDNISGGVLFYNICKIRNCKLTILVLHRRYFPKDISQFSEQLFCWISVKIYLINWLLFWILAYCHNSFPFIVANIMIAFKCISWVYYWMLQYNMFELLLLLCLICGLEIKRELTQLACRRLMIESPFTTQKLVKSQLPKLLELQLTTRILFVFQLTDLQLTDWNFRITPRFYVVVFSLHYFCEVSWNKGKLIFWE